MGKTEEQYRLEAQQIQAREAKATNLEMADIKFVGSNRVVVGVGRGGASSKPGRTPEEAIRTIEFGCDDDGALTHAKAHRALKLDKATAIAVENQDIGYIVKHAYDKIQDTSQSTRVGGG